MRELSDDLSPEEKKVLQDVREEGVHIVHVPTDGDGPGYSFTVGLFFQFEQPEVIVYGLPDEVAEPLLEAVADEASDGKRFAHGKDYKDLLVGYAVRFLDVEPAKVIERLGTAHWAYDGVAFPVQQLIWPDKQQRWPWQEGVREGFRTAQPVLGRHDG